ncbi:hypothetical protein Y1Q_0013771 [Alligator mississippiensis]|uniref:Uncharacterized protein n=1 Tax=Alligator mississippiensis TaxID=8496 RepID=A0A151MMI9_ALLMI|nr:hypothetical protein Y1Q_0013771 [Alligator mississippiensis]
MEDTNTGEVDGSVQLRPGRIVSAAMQRSQSRARRAGSGIVPALLSGIIADQRQDTCNRAGSKANIRSERYHDWGDIWVTGWGDVVTLSHVREGRKRHYIMYMRSSGETSFGDPGRERSCSNLRREESQNCCLSDGPHPLPEQGEESCPCRAAVLLCCNLLCRAALLA